jgi:hypothetical protein
MFPGGAKCAAPKDRWFVADVNGDCKQDLYVYNSADWST